MPEIPSNPLSNEFSQKSELTPEEKLNREVSRFGEADQLAYKDLVARQDVAMDHFLEKLSLERPEKIKELALEILDQHTREQGMHLRPKHVPLSREALAQSVKIEATQKVKVIEKRRIELAGSRFFEEKIQFTRTVKYRAEFNQKATVHSQAAERDRGGRNR